MNPATYTLDIFFLGLSTRMYEHVGLVGTSMSNGGRTCKKTFARLGQLGMVDAEIDAYYLM